MDLSIVVIVVYLAVVTAVGSALSRRAKTSGQWAVAGGSMPLIMVAVGIAGTRIGGAGTYGVAGDVANAPAAIRQVAAKAASGLVMLASTNLLVTEMRSSSPIGKRPLVLDAHFSRIFMKTSANRRTFLTATAGPGDPGPAAQQT